MDFLVVDCLGCLVGFWILLDFVVEGFGLDLEEPGVPPILVEIEEQVGRLAILAVCSLFGQVDVRDRNRREDERDKLVVSVVLSSVLCLCLVAEELTIFTWPHSLQGHPHPI